MRADEIKPPSDFARVDALEMPADCSRGVSIGVVKHLGEGRLVDKPGFMCSLVFVVDSSFDYSRFIVVSSFVAGKPVTREPGIDSSKGLAQRINNAVAIGSERDALPR
jgi:hypothetical protein